jgi:RNA polymerase sigma-32 factor
MPVPGSNSLSLRAAFRAPLLAEQEERALARRYRETGDRSALDRLVTSHMRLVAKFAARYRSGQVAFDDLVSEGAIGLLKAARRFDPDRGLRFASYARFWVEAQIRSHVRQTRSIVVPPRRRVSAQNALADSHAGSTLHADAKLAFGWSGVAPGDVREQGGDRGDDFMERLIDPSDSAEDRVGADQERDERRRLFAAALYRLSDRERYVLTARRLCEEPPTLDALGRMFDISPERVRQIECTALKKVKFAVRRPPRHGANLPVVALPAPEGRGAGHRLPATAAAKPA